MSVTDELGLPRLTATELAEMARLGVVRRPIDSYGVGAFRYSSLKDAIAQALRR